jgi:hypothetical protein
VYRWSFLEPDTVAVLFIWFNKIRGDSNGYFYPFNSRKQVEIEKRAGGSSNRRRRAEEMDRVVQQALRDHLPIRAVIVDRPLKGATRRHLDEVAWKVESYDSDTGACVLRRDNQVANASVPHFKPEKGLVLAENEANAGNFAWQDVTGERYHFPNKYRNKIRPGVRFVYYRGTRSALGERVAAAYFGKGVIGDVYLDPATSILPKRNQKWLADIVEYLPFEVQVPLKTPQGTYIETGTSEVASNFWADGVRVIGSEELQLIEAAGGVVACLAPEAHPPGPLISPTQDLFLVTLPKSDQTTKRQNFNPKRLSRNAKIIGDAAELLFFQYLLDNEPNSAKKKRIIWHARDGSTPGYDIEDARDPKRIIAYEVKGTTGSAFLSFDFTANEMRAARELRDRYAVVLVSNCMGKTPRFQVMTDIYSMLDRKILEAIPAIYRIENRTPFG